jgi:hypothetical protein
MPVNGNRQTNLSWVRVKLTLLTSFILPILSFKTENKQQDGLHASLVFLFFLGVFNVMFWDRMGWDEVFRMDVL